MRGVQTYIQGYYSPGGIVGYVPDRIVMENCYFSGLIESVYDQSYATLAGALVADLHKGLITNCGARASIIRLNGAGPLRSGLVGGMSQAKSGGKL